MGSSCQTFSYAVFHFGDILAECTARAVGHDQTILYERPSEVTPNDPAIQADVRASGDRLFDQDQQQKRLDLIRSCVRSAKKKNELTKRTTSVSRKSYRGRRTHGEVVR